MDDDRAASTGDLDLRLVRSFTVLARHAHFGRAAAALHVAQPALSRQIRRLEDQVGARLLERDARGTRLTEAGEVFLRGAETVLRDARTAVASARAVSAPDRIVVGHVAALLITPAVRALRAAHPEADVRTRHLGWREPRPALLEHRVDVAVARLPFPIDGLSVRHLLDEPRVVVVPRDHPLAGRASVRLADIADEPLPRLPDPDPEWAAFWRVDPRPDGSRAPSGPLVETPEDRLEAVADGRGVALATASVGDGHLRPDLTTVPLEDVDPVAVVLVTRADDRRPLVAAFSRIAREHLAR